MRREDFTNLDKLKHAGVGSMDEGERRLQGLAFYLLDRNRRLPNTLQSTSI